jgi:cytochrome b subunit of formate dehydrogenase
MKKWGSTLTVSGVLCLLTLAGVAHAGEKLKDEDCLTCHADTTLTTVENGKTVSLHVDADKMKQSVHGQMFACVDCHTDVKSLVHTTTPKRPTCTQCHADTANTYAHSYHAKPTKAGAPYAATCADCHGDVHTILPSSDPKSPVAHANVADTCGKCHSQQDLMSTNGTSAQAYFAFESSVHAQALAQGKQNSATCTDCHGTHEIALASDPGAKTNQSHLAETCGKCHTQESQIFTASVHGQGILHGNSMSPDCTGCHGVHAIKSHNDPDSPTAAQNLSRQTCARCHDGNRLSDEFGVPGNKVSSYFDSYHGLATQGGSKVAANCTSCHGVHNILPARDPHSTISEANLESTCGQCHKGVTEKFISTKVHIDPASVVPTKDLGTLINRWVRWIYIVLIICVIGGMLLHNVILWQSKTRQRRAKQGSFMTRMTVNQRWQHLTLLASFILLVITGFALKIPNSWIGHLLVSHAGGERVRSVLHRIAGVVLIGVGTYHIFYLFRTREGRRFLLDMMPKPKDVLDVFGTLRYYLGLSKDRPKFGRFSYAEKAEYWALVWGTVIMAVTGIMMWANVLTGNLLARWWVNVATTIHFYEAIMAALAILVWHFFMVFFDPDVYPMNWAWWDGKMPVEQYRHEHELDTESLATAEKDESAEDETEGPSKE